MRSAATRLHQVPASEGLKGARLGIPRGFYYDAAATPGERGSTGDLNEAQKRVMEEAIAAMKSQGATIVDPPTSRRSSRPTCR